MVVALFLSIIQLSPETSDGSTNLTDRHAWVGTFHFRPDLVGETAKQRQFGFIIKVIIAQHQLQQIL